MRFTFGQHPESMTTLYFMNREFQGHSLEVSEMLEDPEFRALLTFDDSWYFLHYCFFGRDCVCSETSSAVRTHLYNLASALYHHFDTLTKGESQRAECILAIIAEIVDISEYSREFPVCLWAYGDTSTREFLAERLASLPSTQQMENFLNLPHMTRHERDRLLYRYSDDKVSLKRYRSELADYNRRCKLNAKNDQRAKATA